MSPVAAEVLPTRTLASLLLRSEKGLLLLAAASAEIPDSDSLDSCPRAVERVTMRVCLQHS
jgi:hypothetical protein